MTNALNQADINTFCAEVREWGGALASGLEAVSGCGDAGD